MNALSPYSCKNMTLQNRIVMPPMCMFSSDDSGIVKDFHTAHYLTRAIGKVGLIIFEATGISRQGRLSDKDIGMWDDSQIEPMARLIEQIQAEGSKTSIQLSHGGRKHLGNGELVAPSALPVNEGGPVPRELSVDEIHQIVKDFGQAARRAHESGFDSLEIHAAHGYLIHEFISPMSNIRTDAYGGSIEKRRRFMTEVLEEVGKYWPSEKPLIVRVSGTEYLSEGYDVYELAELLEPFKSVIDILHVSTGGNGLAPIPVFPGYQVPYAETLKKELGIDTIAVGRVTTFELVDEILGNGRADLVATGKALLRDANFVLNESRRKKLEQEIPEQYVRAYNVPL